MGRRTYTLYTCQCPTRTQHGFISGRSSGSLNYPVPCSLSGGMGVALPPRDPGVTAFRCFWVAVCPDIFVGDDGFKPGSAAASACSLRLSGALRPGRDAPPSRWNGSPDPFGCLRRLFRRCRHPLHRPSDYCAVITMSSPEDFRVFSINCATSSGVFPFSCKQSKELDP